MNKKIITGFSFRDIADFIIDENSIQRIGSILQNVKENDIIYIKTDYVPTFFNNVFPNISCKIKIITHNSDFSSPHNFKIYLDDDRIIAWYGQNVDFIHDKMIPIPIGIANPQWEHGNQEVLSEVISMNNKKEKLLYVNFKIETNPSVRNNVWSKFSESDYITKSSNLPFKDYLIELSKHKFVISPNGNGFDCHRNWESLYLGTIPIVTNFISAHKLFENLPVLIVDDFSCINKEFLEEKYEEIKSKEYNLEKLDFQYYINKIKMGL